jgi:uncharacterized protein (TIGR03437 family)
MIIGIRPTALTCSAGTIQAGNWLSCEVQLNLPNVPEVARLVISSASPGLEIPAIAITRPGQTRLSFDVYVNPLAVQQSSNVTVQFGETTVNEAIFLTPESAPILNIPGSVAAVYGQPVNFTFSAADPDGMKVALAASNLPDGATFDPGTGAFSWTPTQSQQGLYSVTFTATDSANASSTGQVAITVDSGKPIITSIYNAASQSTPACSPGSVASLAGRWLASVETAVSDPSGASTLLGGTQVKVNGEYVSVVYASPTRVDFVCPAAGAGTPLVISAESNAGIAGPVSTLMYQTSPGIYSMDGTGGGQGLITLAGTSLLAISRDYRALGQPAEPGDSIAIQATGIATPDAAVTVRIADFYAVVQSVQAVPGAAGVYQITAEVPLGIPQGDAVPVVVSLPLDRSRLPSVGGPLLASDAHDRGLRSNQTTIAIERPQ